MFVHAARKGRLDLVLLIYVHISINSTDCGHFLKHSGQIVLEVKYSLSLGSFTLLCPSLFFSFTLDFIKVFLPSLKHLLHN